MKFKDRFFVFPRNEDGLISISKSNGSKITAKWIVDDVFSSYCNAFSFRNFPFDRQTCDLTFETLNVGRYLVTTDQVNWKPPVGNIWNFIQSNVIVNRSEIVKIHFIVKFERNSQLFIEKILFPIWILSLVHISTLILPSELSERPLCNCITFLAYSFVLVTTNNNRFLFPISNETNYLSILIDTHWVTAMATTIYSICTCHWANVIARISHISLTIFGTFIRMPRIRIGDIIFATTIFLIVVTKDSLLVALMIYDP